MKSSYEEILSAMEAATGRMPVDQITNKVAFTRHPSRVRLCLENLQEHGHVKFHESGGWGLTGKPYSEVRIIPCKRRNDPKGSRENHVRPQY